MGLEADKKAIYKKSDNVIARNIEDELILVPVMSNVADVSDALFSLNSTGIEIWNRLDGHTNLNDMVQELCRNFDGPEDEILKDVLGMIRELLSHGIIVKV